MARKEIEEKLKGLRPVLQEKFNVEKIGIFGSYARGEEAEGSDIDILVEFSKPMGWEFIDLKEYLEIILGREVDLVTTGALKPQIKEQILKEVVYSE